MLFGQQTVYQFVRLFLFFFYQMVTKLQTFWMSNKVNASRKYKPSDFSKCSLCTFVHFVPVGVHECNMRFGEQKSQLLLRWAEYRTAYI